MLTVIAACSDSVGPTGGRQVRVSFASAPAAIGASVSRSPSYDIVVGSGTADSIVIDSAQVVLRRIELEASAGDCTADDSSAPGASGCPEVRLGSVLVDLPLVAGVTSALSAAVPAGTYSSIELELHKPGDDASDRAFVAEHPQFANASLRVTGTYRGERFEFTSAANSTLEMQFASPVVIDRSAANVTVQVDVGSWFRDTDGTIIAPTAANASRIANRIQASFRAFEDDDRDGDEG